MLKKWMLLLLIFILFFPTCRKIVEKPDILLITIDTLRRDHLGVYGYPRQTSPFIDSLAKKGVIFKKVITPIPATSGSHASILTSLHPLTHKVTANGLPLSSGVRTIAEVMKANGYYTVGTVAVKVLSRMFKFSRGFDSFSDEWDQTIKYNRKNNRIARDVNKSVFKQIDNYRLNHKEKPLFMWVHYFDPHYGYINWKHISFDESLPDRYLEKSPKIQKNVEKYDKEIYYVDRAIKELYEYLKEKGLHKKMVTCITADHGEQHGDHGWRNGHADFYSETILVPLIFHGYRIPQNIIVDTFVSTMDIGVTLLEMAHLEFKYPTEGKSLLDLMENPGSTQGRDFLIIGYPKFARSLQLIRTPYSYILNFDRWYKHWFFSEENDIPEHKFKRIKKKDIQSLYLKETDEYKIRIHLPRVVRKGLSFAALRFDLKRNEGISAGFEIEPHLSSKALSFDKKVKQVTLLYPVTILDELSAVINKKKLTTLDNLRYTYISKKEFFEYNIKARKINNEIFNGLLTKRKNKKSDEFFNISNDLGMVENLVHKKNYAKNIIRCNQLIYKLFNSYINKKKVLFKKTLKAKRLTKKQKEMLKSLGYL